MNRPEPHLRLPVVAPAGFTAAEFLHMVDLGAFAGMKVELNDGQIVRMTPPYTDHAVAQSLVLRALFDTVRSDGARVVSEIGILLGERTVRAFDAAVIARPALRHKILKPEHVILGIEISDTTLDRDLGEKLRDYASAGISNYWVVDAKARAVHDMSRPARDGYRDRQVVRFGEPLELPQGLGTIRLG
ncbi:MAG: Uma2 family endonuclease [Alphaproteobacteria bacterium]|nr:Uma2 family endonuclease [Alphaproteobacteria bacterium]MBV9370480.1 Uma2 family endonuclease [Alphaproteobacteria bacterium]MBV9901113.1 Uma2 family endonuclease [Alphaproteobacteria bacterium]